MVGAVHLNEPNVFASPSPVSLRPLAPAGTTTTKLSGIVEQRLMHLVAAAGREDPAFNNRLWHGELLASDPSTVCHLVDISVWVNDERVFVKIKRDRLPVFSGG